MTDITTDIETVPVQDAQAKARISARIMRDLADDLARVRAPGNYKDPEKIAAYIAEARRDIERDADGKVQKALADTSFDGGYGQIICIGYAFDDGPTMSHYADDLTLASEARVISAFFASISRTVGNSGLRPRLIGHNHIGFDLPFVWKRAIVHGIRPPLWFPRDPKPWSDNVVDTMLQWAGARGRISMDELCSILGIEGKDGISGADVWPMAQAGRFQEIADYCEGDVARTRKIFNRMTFN